MKKRNILRRILAVVLVLTMATGLTAQAKGDASSTSLKEAQKEKAALEKQLKAAKELINDLKDSKGDVDDKVQELNNELVDISSKITSLENQLADKSTEIADAEAELAQAEADKQKQYDDMKTRIRYMYENSQTTYLEQLLESNSVAEFLNTAEYIAEIQKYDRQKLDEYTENIEYITVAKEQLEHDYADLENMKANVESQKQSVAALMSQKVCVKIMPNMIFSTSLSISSSPPYLSRRSLRHCRSRRSRRRRSPFPERTSCPFWTCRARASPWQGRT